MSDREAPRVFVTYAHDSPEHTERVRGFAAFLRTRIGLDVHLDQWHDASRVDWSVWAIEHLANADFVLVIASPKYKRRADGDAPADEGRGAQFEAAIIRDRLTRDLRRETRRILPVVLPGGSIEDIPTFLTAYSTTRYEIAECTDAGVAALVAAITGHGQYPMPERGQWNDGTSASPCVLVAHEKWLAYGPGVRAGGVSIDGVRYEDSIVLRPDAAAARGFVEVALGGRYQRLTSVVGVPDDAAEGFQVGHFAVHLDGRTRCTNRVAVGRSRTVDLDVTGALRLLLEMYRPGVTGGRAGRWPELAWGDPTLR